MVFVEGVAILFARDHRIAVGVPVGTVRSTPGWCENVRETNELVEKAGWALQPDGRSSAVDSQRCAGR